MCVCACTGLRLVLGFTLNYTFTLLMETDRVSQSYRKLGNVASFASQPTLGESLISTSVG